jgi:hypothetical protein
LVARWFTQNLLKANVVFDHKIVDENADESMSDPDKLPENAPEADLLSVELSEEIAILQGTFSLKSGFYCTLYNQVLFVK